MRTPPCRLGITGHEWVLGSVSWFCANCYLVRPANAPRLPGRVKGLVRPANAPRLPGRVKGPAQTPRHTGVRSDPSKAMRARVIDRDGMVCSYCGRPVIETADESRPDRLTIDHRIPRVRGGTNRIENLAVACDLCNGAKGDKLPDEFIVAHWQAPTKREAARMANEAANRHQETHTRSDGEPKRAYDRDEAFLVAQTLTDRMGRGAMDAFECPDCGWWHVRIVPGLATVLRSKEHRWFDDALICELGLRAVGVMKGENFDGRPGRNFRSRLQRIRSHLKGAERRAKRARARPSTGPS